MLLNEVLKMKEVKSELTKEGKMVFTKIHKVMAQWDDLQADYKASGFLRFSQPIPLAPRKFTEEDVIKFQKYENFKGVKTVQELEKVAQAVYKNTIRKMKEDVKKVDALVKQYHGRVDLFDEGDRFSVQIDLGGLLQFA